MSWLEPGSPQSGTRLLGRQVSAETRACFANLFSSESLRWAVEPMEQARQFAKEGRTDAAMSSFGEGLRRQPRNWVFLGEAALFLASILRDHQAGLELSRLALEVNPTHPDLWNTLGDCQFALGQTDDAHESFQHARRLQPKHARTYHNLIYTFCARRDFESALEMVAKGLACDRSGEYRERLLERQGELLGRLRNRAQLEDRRLRDRL
jgi:tetratricopeptide (TPR) repeat protein